jgi:ATP-dependent DNA helicase RecQ
MILRQMLATGNASLEQKQVEKRKLDAMLGLCETSSCRRQALLNYFKDPHSGNCGNCDMCLNPVESWDGTKAAQKALSCVFRTRQLFGVQHLIDVLCGKETEKTLRFDHHLLSVFGIGKDMKPDEWRSVYHQLIAMGFLHVDIASFGALKLTTQAGLVLKGEKNVMLRKTPKKLPKAKTKKSAKESDVVFSPQEGTLLDEMKALRLQLSREHGVPPYVIFHDRTLMEIAHKRPKDLEELRGLYGVGEHKLTKYGQAFLRVIEGHA